LRPGMELFKEYLKQVIWYNLVFSYTW
jgi:hypothetical protein